MALVVESLGSEQHFKGERCEKECTFLTILFSAMMDFIMAIQRMRDEPSSECFRFTVLC